MTQYTITEKIKSECSYFEAHKSFIELTNNENDNIDLQYVKNLLCDEENIYYFFDCVNLFPVVHEIEFTYSLYDRYGNIIKDSPHDRYENTIKDVFELSKYFCWENFDDYIMKLYNKSNKKIKNCISANITGRTRKMLIQHDTIKNLYENGEFPNIIVQERDELYKMYVEIFELPVYYEFDYSLAEQLHEKINDLLGMQLKYYYNFVISGGLVVGLLFPELFNSNSDCDIWILEKICSCNLKCTCDENKRSIKLNILEMFGSLKLFYSASYKNLTHIFNPNATIKNIQILDFKYNNVLQILNNFDLDICKMALCNNKVIVHAKGYHDLMEKVIDCKNLKIKSIKTVRRLIKYEERGLKLINVNSNLRDTIQDERFDYKEKIINTFDDLLKNIMYIPSGAWEKNTFKLLSADVKTSYHNNEKSFKFIELNESNQEYAAKWFYPHCKTKYLLKNIIRSFRDLKFIVHDTVNFWGSVVINKSLTPSFLRKKQIITFQMNKRNYKCFGNKLHELNINILNDFSDKTYIYNLNFEINGSVTINGCPFNMDKIQVIDNCLIKVSYVLKYYNDETYKFILRECDITMNNIMPNGQGMETGLPKTLG